MRARTATGLRATAAPIVARGALALRLALLVSLVLLLVLTAPTGRAQKNESAAAATEHPLSTQVALDLLGRGGNAADAAAAAALVAGVVNPSSSGIGGGGFALIHRAGDLQPTVLDFRETAPGALDPVTFQQARGLEARGRLVGVPGEVAGLYALVRRFGKLPWAEVVAPAERYARRGFSVGAHLVSSLGGAAVSALMRDHALRTLYFPGGSPVTRGRVIRNQKLANTLRRIAQEGPQAFYEGSVASELSAVVKDAGGTLSVNDLRKYAVKDRQALRGEWGNSTLFTMPPPSAGGLLLLQTAGTLGIEELRGLGWNSGAYQHLLAEAFRASLADRIRYLGDPGQVSVDLARLLDPKRLRKRRQMLALDRTHTTGLFVSRERGTHHLSVADGAGLTVALTTTVNSAFGAKLVAPDSGVLLNDQLADFTLTSDLSSLDVKRNPNPPRPLARPVSSMTPSIVVRRGRAVLAIGGSGGQNIATSVAQLLLGHLAFGKSPEELVTAPRFYLSQRGSTLLVEPGVSEALLRDLTFRGERVSVRSVSSAVQIVATQGDTFRAAADPRKFGSAQVR